MEFRPVPTAHGCHGVPVVSGALGDHRGGRARLRADRGRADPHGSERRLFEIYPEIRGRALRVEGRRLLVETAGGDVVAYLDVSVGAQLHEVAVQSNAFEPQDLTVAVGDTVRWTNTTGDLHNVFSCTEDQFGCEGVAAGEMFTSGQETGFFVFEHTFARRGRTRISASPTPPSCWGASPWWGKRGSRPRFPMACR